MVSPSNRSSPHFINVLHFGNSVPTTLKVAGGNPVTIKEHSSSNSSKSSEGSCQTLRWEACMSLFSRAHTMSCAPASVARALHQLHVLGKRVADMLTWRIEGVKWPAYVGLRCVVVLRVLRVAENALPRSRGWRQQHGNP